LARVPDTSCVSCHESPRTQAGRIQSTELRADHSTRSPSPTHPGLASLINDRANTRKRKKKNSAIRAHPVGQRGQTLLLTLSSSATRSSSRTDSHTFRGESPQTSLPSSAARSSRSRRPCRRRRPLGRFAGKPERKPPDFAVTPTSEMGITNPVPDGEHPDGTTVHAARSMARATRRDPQDDANYRDVFTFFMRSMKGSRAPDHHSGLACQHVHRARLRALPHGDQYSSRLQPITPATGSRAPARHKNYPRSATSCSTHRHRWGTASSERRQCTSQPGPAPPAVASARLPCSCTTCA